MVKWFKTIGSGMLVALLGFAAFMAAAKATQQKALAGKWQDRAVEEEESDVLGATELAKEFRAKAKAHGQAAKQQELKTKERLNAINSRDPSMADITSKWRKPKLRDDTNA